LCFGVCALWASTRLTEWSAVLFEKVICLLCQEILRTLCVCVDLSGSVSCAQEPATDLSPETDESKPHPPITQHLFDPFEYYPCYSSAAACDINVVYFLKAFPPKLSVILLIILTVRYVLRSVFCLSHKWESIF